MALTSTELNYLVWRYLQESGFDLAAFALDKQLHCLQFNSPHIVDRVAPGTLVSLVQKGMLYLLTETDAKGSSLVSLLNSLLREEVEKAQVDAHQYVPPNPIEPEPRPSVTTITLAPQLTFEPCFVVDWHPSSEVFAYGKSNAAVIDALAGSAVAESVTLSHPAVMGVGNDINTVLWLPQGNVIVTVGYGELRAWLPDGKLKNIAATTDESADKRLVGSLVWALSGKFFLLVDTANQVALWDSNLTLIKEIKSLEALAPALVACWLDDTTFAVSTSKHAIRIYSVEQTPTFSWDVQAIGYLHGHKHTITLLIFNSELKLLASCSDYDYAVRVWSRGLVLEIADINAHTITGPAVKHHAAPIVGLFWLNDGDLLSVSVDAVANVWDAATGANVKSTELFKNSDNFLESVTFRSDSLVFAAAVSPDKTTLAVGDDYGTVTLWDVTALVCVGVYEMGQSGDEKSGADEVGICDLQWDAVGKRVCVAYKGAQSVVLVREDEK